MAKITKNTDADTFRIDGEKTRILGTNTEESVAVNEERNTQAGSEASARAKVIAPKGATVRVEGAGKKGTFGRNLADVKLQTAEGEVDYGLVTLDQGMSKYNVDYGTHPNPDQHDIFKEYYSENAPYQYGEAKQPLTTEEYMSVGNNIQAFTKAEAQYKDGDISRQDFEKAMYAAYGDGKKVAQFRYMNHQWERDFQMKDVDGSDRTAYDWAHQSPENKEAYNRAVRNSHTGVRINPEKDAGFWKALWSDTQTSFSALNDFAVMGRHNDLSNARQYSDGELDVPDAELTRGVPLEWHDKIMQEGENYGDDAALQYRDNLIISLQNKDDMAEMPLATQIATAIPAMLLSPATLIPGVKVAQGTVWAGRSISMVMKTGAVRNLAIPAKVVLVGSAGATEASISALPRFMTDDTFSSKEFYNEVLWGAGFGVAVPFLMKGVSATTKRIGAHNSRMKAAQRKVQLAQEAAIDRYQSERNIQYSTEPLISTEPTPKDTTIHGIDIVDEVEMSQLVETTKRAETPIEGAAVTKVEPTKALTIEDLNYVDKLDEGLQVEPKPVAEVAAIKQAKADTRKALQFAADQRVDMVLKKATIPYQRGKTSAVVDATTAGISKSFTQTLLEMPSHTMRFIGSELLELPEGLGGKVIRRPSAALQQHSKKVRYLTQTQPSYHKLIGEYAAENGKRFLGRMKAQHMDGGTNSGVKQFSREVATTLEQRRQGRVVTTQSPSVLKMVDEFDKSMKFIYDDLVESGVAGFKKERRIKHYFPQLWDEGGINGAVTKYGLERVQRLVAKGYLGSKHNDITSMAEAMHTASNFLKQAKESKMLDGAMPATMDSRAKQRLDIDTTVTDGDLSLMDLMETDFSTVSAKYSNRAAGQVALANKGIKSELDIEALRVRANAEGADMQHFEDAMNIVMGRPTRDGLNAALNEVKDAIALSKMGGLGIAQAAEFGNPLARSFMQLVNDPTVFQKLFGMAFETKQGKQLMRETQALSGITNDVHLLDRQATHLDRAEMAKISRVRATAGYIAGKMSFGNWKAPAGYILSQGSGFNMIRRFERRVANASFILDAAKTFKDGTGVMSEARLKDLGLDPKDVDLQNIFRNTVEYDEHGMVKTLNLDKWDKKTREKFHLAMYRDDAQMVQQNIGGENSKHLNKPAMTLVMQFKQAAILANKKQLTRSAQFADKEAVLGTALNMSMAALTRTAKFGTLGAAAYAVTGNKKELQKPWEKDYWQPQKYVAQFGFFPDMADWGVNITKAYDEDTMSLEGATGGVVREVPILGWMKDYYDLGTADSLTEKAEAAKGVAILGNMQFADTIYKYLETLLEE